MINEIVREEWTDAELCDFQKRWKIAGVLATKLHCLATRLEFTFWVISGWRSEDQQQKLIDEGKGAPLHLSTHVTCPATGVDVWPTVTPTNVTKARLGAEARVCGLRWGGGSPVDPDTGIPSDWNHLDLGPRSTR